MSTDALLQPTHPLRLCWWIYAVRGGLAVIFAIVLFLASSFLGIFFFDPVTLVYMSLLLGSFVLGNALLLAVAAGFGLEHHLHFWWVVACEAGFGVLLGIYIGVSLVLTPQSLAFLAGIHAVGLGVFQMMLAVKMKDDRSDLILLALASIVSLAIGIVFLSHVHQAARATTQALSGFELFCGIVWGTLSLRLRG